MKTFRDATFRHRLRRGLLLLLAAGSLLLLGTWLFPGLGTLPLVLAGAALLAAGVSVAAALALVRRESLRSKRTGRMLARFRQAADASSDLITIFSPAGRIEYVNDAVTTSTGYKKTDLLGRRQKPCLPWYGDAGLARTMRETAAAGDAFIRVIEGRTRNGDLLPIHEHVAPFRDDRGAVIRCISTARDLSREHSLEDRLDYLDRYDPLTGLPNRRELIVHIEAALAAARTNGASVSLLVIDIDRFTQVNDLCGSEAGDEVLRTTARLVRSSVAPSDIVARAGNDEFAVVHTDRSDPELAGAVARQLRDAVGRAFAAAGQEVSLTCSIGIAVHPRDGKDAWSLLKNADLALARAKAQGRNVIQFFEPEIAARVKEFFVLERRLFAALRNNEYLLHYQPYCDLRTRKVAGAEALIRWQNPELGTVAPARFIPSLEETGKVIEVGQWILETACRQIKEWGDRNRHFPVSVNLSLAQFRSSHLVSMVRDLIDSFRFDPQRLTLEVTETVFMQDMEFAVRTLKRLKDVGVSLSVDDFGTGYSSLSYIKKLPVDNLKIDISFVRDVTRDQDSASIITAITTLARSLNLKTIAEGVETEEQRKILHLLRCDMGQGFYFSKAVAAGDFDRFLG